MAIYTPELGQQICEEIASGDKGLAEIGATHGISKSLILKWAIVEPEFRDWYARAKEIQAEAMAEEILEISDDGTNDWMVKRFGETEVEMPNPEVLQRSKLRVETRKWLMSKLLAKKYGDKQLHTGSDGEGPINFVLTRIGEKK